MNKHALLQHIIERLSREAETLANAARTAHADATHTENKAENKYDTRGLEASYLAGAQAKMAAASFQNLASYSALDVKEFSDDTPIAVGALIELESLEGVRSFYFLGPKGGGIEVEYEGIKVLLITPSSPMGGKLVGCEVGDSIKVQSGTTVKEYEIVSVR